MTKFAIITRAFTFEGAHFLPGHQGKCARLHGHSYRLEISLRGPVKETPGQSDDGMVMDFGDLSHVVHETILNRLDHQNLNEVTGIHTTAENLAHWIWKALLAGGLAESLLYCLRLQETEKNFVEITHAEQGE